MKSSFNSLEKAYVAISQSIACFPNGRAWDEVVGKYEVVENMVSATWWLSQNDSIDKKWHHGDDSYYHIAREAVRYLRDEMLRISGHKFWGLTFTLKPDGKFKIDYDYNKPEGYEETDETVEINLSQGGEGLLKRIQEGK
jgi:hypothetical protein